MIIDLIFFFLGKMFKSRDLPMMVEFFLMFYQDKPIDWLLDYFLAVKVCNPEKDHVRQRNQKMIDWLMSVFYEFMKILFFFHLETLQSNEGRNASEI